VGSGHKNTLIVRPTYHVCKKYVTYIVAMRPSLISQLQEFRLLICMCTMNSHELDLDTEKQHRHDNARLTKSGNTRSEQLLVMPTESLSNREWLPGELLSESKC